MTYTVEEITEMFHADGVDAFDEIVEEGEWVSDYKRQHRTDVVQHGDQYFQIIQSRTGSYYTDYHYDNATITEVTPREEVVTKTLTFWDPV